MSRARDAPGAAEYAPLNAQAREVIGFAAGAVLLAAIVVSLRIYTRGFLLRVLGREDWTIVLALLFSIGNTIGMCFQAILALGKHISTLSQQEKARFFKAAYFTIISYNISIALVKLSIILLYLRVFTLVYIRQATYATLAAVILISLWSIFSSVFFCIPIAAFWDPEVAGSCLPREPRWLSGATLNIVSDFMIFALPLPVVGRLRIARRQKIGLCFVFAVGFFVCVVSIIRLPYLRTAATTKDPSGDNPMVAKWSIIELNTAIICASLTTLRPLISHIFPTLLGTTASNEHAHQGLSSSPPPTIGSGNTPEHATSGHGGSTTFRNMLEIVRRGSDDQASLDALQLIDKNESARVASREYRKL